jgi:hypothetical protein
MSEKPKRILFVHKNVDGSGFTIVIEASQTPKRDYDFLIEEQRDNERRLHAKGV